MDHKYRVKKQKYTPYRRQFTTNEWLPEPPARPHLSQFIHTHQKGGILWTI